MASDFSTHLSPASSSSSSRSPRPKGSLLSLSRFDPPSVNPGVIWGMVRPSYILPAIKKGVVRRKSSSGRGEGYVEEDGSGVFLIPGEEKGGRPPMPPRGFVAVYVGPEMRRFVIPASYLCLPAFRALMEQAEEEFGFQQEGGLQIPCDEAAFEEVLRGAAVLDGGAKNRRKLKKAFSR
ncbi:hypothetical protein Taro_030373 [Colocasia esculenta]|uniref:Uncharacterized protein n=1 Tax=Colocasia esculenta TaxID=4460 RepID=A0A843VMA4_COLES|nr:hypothetical protein [Colocasia esculenta]